MPVCYFLGAGASAEFGVPVTSQIMPLISKGLEAGNLFGHGSRKSMAAELKTFLIDVFPGFDAPGVTPPSITDVLSLIDFSIAGSTTLRRCTPVADLLRFRWLMEVAICVVISGIQGFENNLPLRRFWQWMSERNGKTFDSVRVISTNYDCSIESVLKANLDFDQLTQKVDFGFDWRDPDRERPYQRPNPPWLRYYKLHGSLNWLRCDFCEHVYLNNEWEIFDRVMDEEIADYNSCHCGHGKLGLLLVTPSYMRDVREPNLTEIWRHALEALRTSRKWVIAGYSLPADDLLIRSMFIRAYAGRMDGPPDVTVAAWGEDEERDARYRLLFPACRITRDGFGKHIGRL